MRFLKSIMVLSIMALVALATGCSSEDAKPFFQNNHVSAEPGDTTNPFTGLPDLDNLDDFAGEAVSAIGELFSPGSFNLLIDAPDYRTMLVDNINQIIDNPAPDGAGTSDANEFRRVAAFDVLTEVVPGLADDYGTGHGAYGLFAALRDIVGYIINQETLDDTGGSYIDELYTYLDKLDDADLDMKHDVYQLMYKGVDYIDDTYSSAEMETIMADLRSFLSDTTDQNFTGLLYTMQEGLGKILMRADSYIEFDDPLDAHGSESNGLGNSVAGVDFLLAGLTGMISTTNTLDGAAAREDLYDMLRVVGEMIYSLKGAGPTYYPVLKYLLTNIEDYYTVGGANFTGDYNHPMAASPNNYYTNAELHNSVKEMWPSIAKLFIRERDDAEDNTDNSIVGQTPAATQSPVEMLARGLYQLKVSGIDYSQAGNEVEPSLKKMVTYNAYGEDRSTAAYKVSLLDHTAVTIGVGYNYGFLTRTISPAAASGEPDTNQGASGNANYGATNTISYQHGASTRGVLTINDTMYSWTSGGVHISNEYLLMTTLDVWTDAYNLSLAQRYQWDDGRGNHTGQGKYVWRSNSSFTPAGGATAQTGDDAYEYYMGYDFPAQCLLGPSAAGDVGIPNGGRPVHGNNDSLRPNSNSATITAPGATFDRNDFRTYFPKVADGKGCLNTAAWQFNWISRSCWDGAGPYYSTSDGVLNTSLSPAPTWTGHATFSVYYKPNGEVYAYVDKTGTPWVYFYPSKDSGNCRNRDGVTISNDVADPDDANGQRFNRYRDTYKSDYYAVQMGHEHGGTTLCGNQVSYANGLAFCVPPMNPSGGSYYDSGRGKYYLASGSFSAQQFWTRERVWEGSNANVANADDANYPVLGNMARECATHEEAIFRNYQWLLYEKKFMFIIPQCLFAAWEASALGFTSTAYLDSGAYVVLEANGLVGLANLKKNSTGNGYWNIRNTEGVGADPAGNRNSPDYGNSYRPGDSRVLTFAHYFTSPAPGTTTNGEMNPNVLYGLFGSGHVLPDIIGGNLAPVQRLGFVDQPGYIGSVPVSATAAPAGRGFLTSDACYTGRNKVLALFVALAGMLSDGTYYEAASSGYNYNYASTNHKYPLLDFLEGIMIPLSKPLMRLYDDGGAVYGKRWVPRMMDETGSGVFDYFAPFTAAPYNNWNSFRPLNTLYPLGKFLADQNVGATYNDGLIPTLANNNIYLVTKMLGLLQRMGNNSSSSLNPYRDGAAGGGVLENVSKGLEQVVTSLQIDRGNNYVSSYSWIDSGRYDRKLNSSRYGWMYTDVASRVTGTPAPISADLEVALDQLIGHTDTTGISEFIDDHPIGATWNNYDRLLNAAGEMMGNSAGLYYIMGSESTHGNLVHVINNMLTATTMTTADRQALRHTLGVLMARYDGGWVTNTELRDILRTYLPEVMTSATGHYENLLIALKSLMDVDNDGIDTNGDGIWDNPADYEINDYLVDLLIHGDTAGEVIPEMYDLLNSGSMWDSAYYNATYPNKATLKELVDICSELSLEIEDYL